MGADNRHTYEFGYSSNSYFNGRDGFVTRNDGESILINTFNGCMAVNVKDHNSPRSELDNDRKRKLDEIIKAKGAVHFDWGTGDFEDLLYERIKEQWWYDATWLTTEDSERPIWTTGVYSEGRSGGWCVIEGTEALASDFFDNELDEMRHEFLDLAFALVENIKTLKQYHMSEAIDDEFSELEKRREENVVLGYN